jgi:hypothetical protein
MSSLLLFGGMNMKLRALLRYKKLYPDSIQSLIVPLELRHLWMSPNFDSICEKIDSSSSVHVHCLSGGVLQYTRLLRTHPTIKSKITTEVFDNPAHADGFSNFMHEYTNLPSNICTAVAKMAIPGPLAQSEYFLKQPMTNASRMVILSRNDRICDPKYIHDMLAQWSIPDDCVWENECRHLKTLQTFPYTYKTMVNMVLLSQQKK